MIIILLRVSVILTFLSYAGIMVFNMAKDILITNLNDLTVIYVAITLQLLINIIYYAASFMVWLLISFYIIRYPEKLGKIIKILMLVKHLFLVNNWPTRILFISVAALILVFWLPAVCPFLHIIGILTVN